MEYEFDIRKDRLEAAAARGDTTAIWRIISSTAEKTFSDFFWLLGKERKAMTGRGTFRKQKHTMKAQGGCQLNATNEARELRKTAEAYATQARRLGHTADRAKRIGATSISENLKEELNT